MANDVKFEGKERRMAKIEKCLAEYGLASLEEARDLCLSKGIDVDKIVKGVQPIAFENASWAYTLGCAVALKKGVQFRCGRCRVHRHWPAGVLCSRFRCGDTARSAWATATWAPCCSATRPSALRSSQATSPSLPQKALSALPSTANRARKEPLRIILNGLGKDAAYIISRINGFTYVKTDYDFFNDELKIVEEKAFSDGERAAVKCYGANDVLEGVAIMKHEGVDVSITGNSTNPTRFQHLVAGTYKKWAIENGKHVLLRCFRRRHGPYPAPGQHGGWPGFLWPDRLHGPYARRRAVRRLFLRPGARRDDGLDRHGQQPDGRRDRRMRCCCVRGLQIIGTGYRRFWQPDSSQ